MIPAGECGKCTLEHNRCHAHTYREDEVRPCGAYPIRGGSVCPVHGGMAPQVQARAAQALVERQAQQEAMTSMPRRRPSEILLDALHRADVRAQQAEEAGQEDAVSLRVYATNLARTVIDKDLEATAVRLREEEAAQLATLFGRVFGRLGLTVDQRALVPDVVAEELKAVGAWATTSLEQAAKAITDEIHVRRELQLASVVVEAWKTAMAGVHAGDGQVELATQVFIRSVRERLASTAVDGEGPVRR